jgi:drug/metabolite transporter (DMT)-like permease
MNLSKIWRALKETKVEVADVRPTLWNGHIGALSYDAQSEKYRTAILEQYKIYVEMADRVSARRALANTFFLTLNTAVFTAIGVFWNRRPEASAWWLLFPLVVLLGQCTAWFWLIRSYRQLNAAKWTVVGALEEQLPASPYWSAEWKAVGEGDDPSKYWPLTHLEQWIPVLFAACYLGGFLAVLLS